MGASIAFAMILLFGLCDAIVHFRGMHKEKHFTAFCFKFHLSIHCVQLWFIVSSDHSIGVAKAGLPASIFHAPIHEPSGKGLSADWLGLRNCRGNEVY